MESVSVNNQADYELDPRIQIELEKLNTATDEINKLEIELDEANTTFRMLLNESTRRLKVLGKKLGSCIDRSRPYYEALEVAKNAQLECQRAAVLYQRANEIHAAAKETVALAEQRFLSNQHEWQFDNAWQEMLNHATIKVMEAESQKAESGREHQGRAALFNAAEQKVQRLEEQLRRHIIKSRPYFEEKALCQEQLNTQKERIEFLQRSVTHVKVGYAQSLKELESISEEIHRKRKSSQSGQPDEEVPCGPREPGVGAELEAARPALPDLDHELDKCRSLAATPSSVLSELDDDDDDPDDLNNPDGRAEAQRPVDGGEGCSSDHLWQAESSARPLDHRLLLEECAQQLTYGHSSCFEKCNPRAVRVGTAGQGAAQDAGQLS